MNLQLLAKVNNWNLPPLWAWVVVAVTLLLIVYPN
jgi:hypothetical protein